MEIDAVYTWVNHRDSDWKVMHRLATGRRDLVKGEHDSVNDPARYTSRDELYYSIRSLLRYAPWIRRIHLVTNCSAPEWSKSIPNLFYVRHEEVFPDSKDLPTFNAFAIETVLHKIEGLSENFLYFNDDMFLCKDVSPEDFFWRDGCPFYFPSTHDIPAGPASAQNRPVDNGAMNAAYLLERDFDFRAEKKLHHAPYPLSRSLLQEIESRYEPLVKSTRSHAFRHPADVAMSTTLQAYYALCSGRGRKKNVAARYVDIGDPLFIFLVHPWSPLMRGKYTFLCLNEVASMKRFTHCRDRVVSWVMRRLFSPNL